MFIATNREPIGAGAENDVINTSRTTASPASPAPLWQHNRLLLDQAVRLIEQLLQQAGPDFDYAKAVGPQLRHILDHYSALLLALSPPASMRVAYDVRARDAALQSEPRVALAKLEQLGRSLRSASEQRTWTLNTPLVTVVQAGLSGELEVCATSTLGRELLFLASHTVHHFALISLHCKAAGLQLDDSFGKAPATLAYEGQRAA